MSESELKKKTNKNMRISESELKKKQIRICECRNRN